MNQSIKVPKVGMPTNKKRYYKTLGTSVKKQSNVPSLPGFTKHLKKNVEYKYFLR